MAAAGSQLTIARLHQDMARICQDMAALPESVAARRWALGKIAVALIEIASRVQILNTSAIASANGDVIDAIQLRVAFNEEELTTAALLERAPWFADSAKSAGHKLSKLAQQNVLRRRLRSGVAHYCFAEQASDLHLTDP